MGVEERTLEVMEDILKWTRFQGALKAREVLQSTLESDQEKLIYHHSDGNTSREVAKIVGVTRATVTKAWKHWNTFGIVESVRVKGGGHRYVRVFDLQDFGIPMPPRGSRKTITKELDSPETDGDNPEIGRQA
ncbi:MAG: hypothetical protein V3U51_05255 [Thermoplasmata archaeon]